MSSCPWPVLAKYLRSNQIDIFPVVKSVDCQEMSALLCVDVVWLSCGQ